MGKNSIQSNLTKDDLIAEIRLTLGADFKREHTVIIVEGEDDISFFNGKLSSNVDIRESFSGKRGVLEIVSLFSDSRVITSLHKESTPHLFTERKCFLHHIHFICGLQNGQQLIRPANQTESSVYL